MLPQHQRNNVGFEPQTSEPPFEIDYSFGKEGEPLTGTEPAPEPGRVTLIRLYRFMCPLES